ncbi:YcaO-like family protein [Cellulomonas telluris]|uniref:YcaO-like family protein n=1 Tax=Cellulomonas telluris TaxID=2306636 RepID=UPI0010A77659|nr:YcaO-like family protein [Cellulomonas telluris]
MTTTPVGTPATAPAGAPPRHARVEVRPLDPTACVVTTPDDVHHVVGLPAATVQLLVASWDATVDGLVDPALAVAARPLRALLTERRVWDAPAPPPAPAPPRARPGLDVLLTGDADLVAALADRAGPGAALDVIAWDPRAVVNRAYASGRLLVVAVRGPRDGDLADVDRMCHDMRVPWLPVELTRGRAWAGPLVTPGVGASFEDAVARRTAASRDHRVHRAVRTPAPGGDAGPPPDLLPDVLDAVLDVVADASARAHDGIAAPGDVLHEVTRGDGGVVHVRHPVLPLPHRSTVHRPHPVDDLVDPRTGLVLRVRDVRHHPSVPAALVTRQCDVGDVRAVSPWANNVLCQGSAFSDPDGASAAAVGESVERYCGNVLDTLPVTHASWDELRRRGAPALDPEELVLYSDAQYGAPGFPFVPLTRDLPVHWVPGRSLTRDREVLVPASLVYVNWYSAGYASAPPTNFCAFAGIAAGPDEDFAVASALEEVVERHATMVWWLNGHPLPAVVPDAALASVVTGRTALLHLDNEFGVPVAAAVVHDDADALVNVGFSARPRFRDAALKAWTEAFTLQEGSRDLLRRDGLHWQVMADGELNGRAFKPWRADRRYLDDFRPDMRDCDDLMVQQQVYLDPRAGRRVEHLLAPPATRALDDVPHLPDRSAATYRAAVEEQGLEVVVVDLTTPDVASTGMRVVRVLVPGTVGNAPAAFPFLGRRRVQDLAVELGWREEPLAEHELLTFPMPHA